MNTPSPRPRPYCRLVRLWIAPDRPSRHVESCEDCRRYFAASTRLEVALSRDATRFAPPAPAGLEPGIMQAIRAASPVTAPAPVRHGWFAVAGAVAAAAVALTVILLHHAPQAGSGGTLAAIQPTLTPAALVLDGSMTGRLWNAVVPRAGTLVADNPLQTELDAVYSDTRTALDFLALNFLPSTSVDSAEAVLSGAKG